MHFSAYLFDMDGTLIDNMGVHSQIWCEFLALHGVHITTAQFYALAAGRTNEEILHQLISPALTAEQVAQMSAEKERIYRLRYAPLLKPLAGLPAFLQAARAHGIRTAVASSAGRENIEFHLTGLKLCDGFDAVVGAEDVPHGKPHPDLFLTAARRLGVEPAACLVFEDSPTGLEAARRAGMRALALTTSYDEAALRRSPAVWRVERDFTPLSPLELG